MSRDDVESLEPVHRDVRHRPPRPLALLPRAGPRAAQALPTGGVGAVPPEGMPAQPLLRQRDMRPRPRAGSLQGLLQPLVLQH